MSKHALRRTWFQVHKWIGLLLAILIIPLSLSGSALVWRDQLERASHPERYAVTGDALLAPDRYVAAAQGALKPGDRVSSLAMPDGRGPVIVTASGGGAGPQRAGPPERTLVYLDPPTGRVLGTGKGMSGLVRFAHDLHGQLFVFGVGRTIVGWLGIAMMISAFTGLWLWWPTAGRFSRAFRWRRRPETDLNLHHMIGFWIALPLFVLSLTGAWIAFPTVFGALTGQHQGPGDRERMAAMRAKPLERPAQPLGAVVARAGTVGTGELRTITWPTERSADWSVAYARPGRGPMTVLVADDTGAATAAPAKNQGGAMRLVRAIHSGEGTPFLWQLIVFLGGVAPAVLAVTGVLIWWRVRRVRSERAGRRAQARPAGV